MASKETPQENTEDMSIDELSAAIDAHMDEISKPKPKKKKTAPKATKKSVPTPVAKKKEEPKEKAEEEASEETKIAVKYAYISKQGEKSKPTLPEKEKNQVTHTSNVKLKPLSEVDEETSESKTTNKPKADTVDIVVKTPSKSKLKEEPKEEVTEAEPELEEETEVVDTSEEEVKEERSEPTEPIETREKPVIKPETPKSETMPQPTNDISTLDAQIPSAKPTGETTIAPEGEALKTFDTKQYHIPIKASHHHRAGGSFKVFIAVLAVILATIYVLSELEIIDLAALVST